MNEEIEIRSLVPGEDLNTPGFPGPEESVTDSIVLQLQLLK